MGNQQMDAALGIFAQKLQPQSEEIGRQALDWWTAARAAIWLPLRLLQPERPCALYAGQGG